MFQGEPWMDEHSRTQPRRRVLFVSTFSTATETVKCKVRDLSVNGALVESDRKLALGDAVNLSLPKIGIVAAEVAWVNNFRSGMLFKSMLDPFQLREMLEAKIRPSDMAGTGAPRWERPKTVLDAEPTQERSRGAVAWLRLQKQTSTKE
jgi:hypothetical protein